MTGLDGFILGLAGGLMWSSGFMAGVKNRVFSALTLLAAVMAVVGAFMTTR